MPVLAACGSTGNASTTAATHAASMPRTTPSAPVPPPVGPASCVKVGWNQTRAAQHGIESRAFGPSLHNQVERDGVAKLPFSLTGHPQRAAAHAVIHVALRQPGPSSASHGVEVSSKYVRSKATTSDGKQVIYPGALVLPSRRSAASLPPDVQITVTAGDATACFLTRT
jgi:hypothetical protein